MGHVHLLWNSTTTEPTRWTEYSEPDFLDLRDLPEHHVSFLAECTPLKVAKPFDKPKNDHTKVIYRGGEAREYLKKKNKVSVARIVPHRHARVRSRNEIKIAGILVWWFDPPRMRIQGSTHYYCSIILPRFSRYRCEGGTRGCSGSC